MSLPPPRSLIPLLFRENTARRTVLSPEIVQIVINPLVASAASSPGRALIRRRRLSAYGLTPLGSRPPRPRGSVCNFSSTGLPSQIA
jgi:hypothetical protein